MNILKLYQDYGIMYATEGHKHTRPNWINTPCPYCTGNPGLHLGCTLDGGHFYCWRCGWHPVIPTLAKLLNLSLDAVHKVIRTYGGRAIKTEIEVIIRVKAHRLPTNTGIMGVHHKRYLAKRLFDPDKLEAEWGLLGTGPIALVTTGEKNKIIDFKHRILAPIMWNGEQVSYQARDITNRHNLKYITCPKDRELVFHKNILYGKQDHWRPTGICVEGMTDVWRFGPCAFATFGIEYMRRQMMIMAKEFKRVWVAFDDDPQAIIQAEKLVSELKFRGVESERVLIVGDPGGMDQAEADYLVKELIS